MADDQNDYDDEEDVVLSELSDDELIE